MQLNRSDGALVRLVTSLNPDESPAQADHRLQTLLEAVQPQLNHFIPD
jgi:hypothetical protein